MPAFDPLTYRYASRRNVVYAKNAGVDDIAPRGIAVGQRIKVRHRFVLLRLFTLSIARFSKKARRAP